MKKTLTIIGLAAFASLTGSHAQIITQWNFNAENATPSIGSGTISLIGGATNSGYNSGAGSSDPTQPGFGYQTTTYPAQSTASGTAGIQLDVSTASFQSPTYTGIQVSFDLRTSNTSSRWFRIDYTTNGGIDWTLGSAVRMGAAANAGDTWHNGNSLLINDVAALDNANFGFRIVSVFSPDAFTEAASSTNYAANTAYEVARNTTSTYGGGTWRFDMITVTAVPEPSTFLLIGLGSSFLLLNTRRRRA